MTTGSLDRRLRKIEHAQGLHGDLEQMTDAQLWRIVRASYRQLAAEHGSLAQATTHLRTTGHVDDAYLAALIEEDTGGPNAVRH